MLQSDFHVTHEAHKKINFRTRKGGSRFVFGSGGAEEIVMLFLEKINILKKPREGIKPTFPGGGNRLTVQNFGNKVKQYENSKKIQSAG
jgi:hypothetical protein